MLAVFPAASVRTIEFSVRLAAMTWSLGASVIVTGTDVFAAVMLVEVPLREDSAEQPATMMAAATAAEAKAPVTPRGILGALVCIGISLKLDDWERPSNLK